MLFLLPEVLLTHCLPVNSYASSVSSKQIPSCSFPDAPRGTQGEVAAIRRLGESPELDGPGLDFLLQSVTWGKSPACHFPRSHDPVSNLIGYLQASTNIKEPLRGSSEMLHCKTLAQSLAPDCHQGFAVFL